MAAVLHRSQSALAGINFDLTRQFGNNWAAQIATNSAIQAALGGLIDNLGNIGRQGLNRLAQQARANWGPTVSNFFTGEREELPRDRFIRERQAARQDVQNANRDMASRETGELGNEEAQGAVEEGQMDTSALNVGGSEVGLGGFNAGDFMPHRATTESESRKMTGVKSFQVYFDTGKEIEFIRKATTDEKTKNPFVSNELTLNGATFTPIVYNPGLYTIPYHRWSCVFNQSQLMPLMDASHMCIEYITVELSNFEFYTEELNVSNTPITSGRSTGGNVWIICDEDNFFGPMSYVDGLYSEPNNGLKLSMPRSKAEGTLGKNKFYYNYCPKEYADNLSAVQPEQFKNMWNHKNLQLLNKNTGYYYKKTFKLPDQWVRLKRANHRNRPGNQDAPTRFEPNGVVGRGADDWSFYQTDRLTQAIIHTKEPPQNGEPIPTWEKDTLVHSQPTSHFLHVPPTAGAEHEPLRLPGIYIRLDQTMGSNGLLKNFAKCTMTLSCAYKTKRTLTTNLNTELYCVQNLEKTAFKAYADPSIIPIGSDTNQYADREKTTLAVFPDDDFEVAAAAFN